MSDDVWPGMRQGPAFAEDEERERAVLWRQWRRLDAATRVAWLLASRLGSLSASSALLNAAGVGATSRRALQELHLLEAGSSGRFWMHGHAAWFGRTVAGDAQARNLAQHAFVRGVLRYFRVLDLGDYVGFLSYLADRASIDEAVSCAEVVLRDDFEALVTVLRRSGAALALAGATGKARSSFRRAAVLEERWSRERSPEEELLSVAESLWW